MNCCCLWNVTWNVWVWKRHVAIFDVTHEPFSYLLRDIFFKANSIWSNECLIRHAHPKNLLLKSWRHVNMSMCSHLFEDFMTLWIVLSDRCYFKLYFKNNNYDLLGSSVFFFGFVYALTIFEVILTKKRSRFWSKSWNKATCEQSLSWVSWKSEWLWSEWQYRSVRSTV